jgi:hypothetical protein
MDHVDISAESCVTALSWFQTNVYDVQIGDFNVEPDLQCVRATQGTRYSAGTHRKCIRYATTPAPPHADATKISLRKRAALEP